MIDFLDWVNTFAFKHDAHTQLISCIWLVAPGYKPLWKLSNNWLMPLNSDTEVTCNSRVVVGSIRIPPQCSCSRCLCPDICLHQDRRVLSSGPAVPNTRSPSAKSEHRTGCELLYKTTLSSRFILAPGEGEENKEKYAQQLQKNANWNWISPLKPRSMWDWWPFHIWKTLYAINSNNIKQWVTSSIIAIHKDLG